MPQQPAVVIIARHGARLDAADQSWHLSTPTPYDPPLTYGGWNQCRQLGVRIASLLHERELRAVAVTTATDDGESVTTQDFGSVNANGKRKDGPSAQGPRKRTKRKHRVVIHSSPFLRCLETSVAIAAGMGQYAPAIEAISKKTSSRPSTMEGLKAPELPTIAETRSHSALSSLPKPQDDPKRYRKAKLRVDAFLGEWLNPQYFEGITPPPPSAMMVATAKAELMENQIIEGFDPSPLGRVSGGDLWASGNGLRSSALDDWSHIRDELPVRLPKRERASSQSSVGSSGSGSGRKSPFRPGGALQPLTSVVPKPELSVYHPPTPHYAISGSDFIPRGYVAHAKNACTTVDYHWDSSRPPLSWGDGGEHGEEWSAMHKRFRKGLNHLIEWYSRHNSDERAEDALGIDHADQHNDEEEEDLVVVLVTHGAGCNALIGALTGQPVLLDVGMASLTMAVRKENASPLVPYAPSKPLVPDAAPRRGSLDLGLSSVYDMKMVSSSDHLRPGAGSSRSSSHNVRTTESTGPRDPTGSRDALAALHHRLSSVAARDAAWNLDGDAARSNTNSTLGSIRRPLTPKVTGPTAVGAPSRSNTLAFGDLASFSASTPGSPGLWTPPASRTPAPQQQALAAPPEREDAPKTLLFKQSDSNTATDTLSGTKTSPSESHAETNSVEPIRQNGSSAPISPPPELDQLDSGSSDERGGAVSDNDVVTELPSKQQFGEKGQPGIRGGFAKDVGGGLWAAASAAGPTVQRRVVNRREPKRRWTVNQD